MGANPFHLGWFGSFTRTEWNGRWSGSDARSWANGEFHIELARSLERACFDYMMFEDSLMVSDFYGGSNLGNDGLVETSAVAMHGQPQSVNLVLPPLATIYLLHTG